MKYFVPVGALLGAAVEVVDVLNVVVVVDALDVLEVAAADDVPGMHWAMFWLMLLAEGSSAIVNYMSLTVVRVQGCAD